MRKILACFSYPPSYRYILHPPTPDKGDFVISVIGACWREKSVELVSTGMNCV